MSAGRFRNLAELQKPVKRNKLSGDPSQDDWKRVDDIWVGLKPIGGTEDRQPRDNTDQRYVVEMHYRTDVTNRMRLLIDGQIHEIETSVDRMNRKQFLQCQTIVRGS